jgi:hypothetical protein
MAYPLQQPIILKVFNLFEKKVSLKILRSQILAIAQELANHVTHPFNVVQASVTMAYVHVFPTVAIAMLVLP